MDFNNLRQGKNPVVTEAVVSFTNAKLGHIPAFKCKLQCTTANGVSIFEATCARKKAARGACERAAWMALRDQYVPPPKSNRFNVYSLTERMRVGQIPAVAISFESDVQRFNVNAVVGEQSRHFEGEDLEEILGLLLRQAREELTLDDVHVQVTHVD